VPLDLETILHKASYADFWRIAHAAPQGYSLSMLVKENPLYAAIKPFREGTIIFCNTSYSGYFEKGIYEPHFILADLIYFFHPGRLANLINFRTVHINHVYPAWALEGKGFWRFDQYGKMIAPPGFNQALSRLAELCDARKILPTTIAKHLAYVEAISELEYNIIAQGHVDAIQRIIKLWENEK